MQMKLSKVKWCSLIGHVTTMGVVRLCISFAQRRPPRRYAGNVNSNLPSGISMEQILTYFHLIFFYFHTNYMHIYIRSMSSNILCSPRLHFGQTAGCCKVDMGWWMKLVFRQHYVGFKCHVSELTLKQGWIYLLRYSCLRAAGPPQISNYGMCIYWIFDTSEGTIIKALWW